MSEQTGVTGTTGEPNSQVAEGGKDFTAITSQADFDAAIQNRLARERAKFADYDDLKTAAGKFAEFEESQKSEAQKQSERLAAVERENAELKLASARAEIGAARNIDPSVMAFLAGSTREEITAAADALVAFKGASAPQKLIIPSEGKAANVAANDESDFVKELFSGGAN